MDVQKGPSAWMVTRSGIAVWAVVASPCCFCMADLAPGMITWSRSQHWRRTAWWSSMINSRCGRSDQPDDRSLWQLERFVAEVDTVRRALHLEQLHLLGHPGAGGSPSSICSRIPQCSQSGTGQHLGQHSPVCGRSRALEAHCRPPSLTPCSAMRRRGFPPSRL